MLTPREIQDGAAERGYIDRATFLVLQAEGLFWWLHAEGVSGPAAESALGLKAGTALQFAAARGWPTLTGYTGKARVQPPSWGDSPYGSGIEGTQGPAAPPAAVYSPKDPLGPPPETAEERAERWRHQVKVAGWKFPDDAIAIAHDARNHGYTNAEAETIMGWPAGSLPEV